MRFPPSTDWGPGGEELCCPGSLCKARSPREAPVGGPCDCGGDDQWLSDGPLLSTHSALYVGKCWQGAGPRKEPNRAVAVPS